MKTIQLQIDDNNYDSFLTIIQNLKDGFIKKFVVNDSIENVSNEEQKEIETLLSARTEEEKQVAFSKTIQIDI